MELELEEFELAELTDETDVLELDDCDDGEELLELDCELALLALLAEDGCAKVELLDDCDDSLLAEERSPAL